VRRQRKLLLNRSEIRKIAQALDAGGRALVPLRLYFKGALVKVEVALATGKKQFDKREDLKKRAEIRDRDRAMRFRR
jgi:SsrA-binding protein